MVFIVEAGDLELPAYLFPNNIYIVEAGELELIKIKYNFLNDHCYHKNGNYALPYMCST